MIDALLALPEAAFWAILASTAAILLYYIDATK